MGGEGVCGEFLIGRPSVSQEASESMGVK